MSNHNLFAPLMRSHPELSGTVVIEGRSYQWQLHPERIPADWQQDEVDHAHGGWTTPGWAFGLTRLTGGKWLPVKDAEATHKAWQLVRREPAVQAAIRRRARRPGAAR